MANASDDESPDSDESTENSKTEFEPLFREIVENVPIMVFVKEADELRFTYLNPVGEEIFGHPVSDVVGKNDHDFFPDEQAEYFTRKDREVLESGEPADIPKEPVETERGTRFLHTKKVPILDEEGEPQYLLGISADITERERIRASLEQTERRQEVILEEAHEAFIGMDEQGRVIDWNRQAVETFGWSKEEAVGRELADLIIPERYRDEHRAGLERFFESGEGRLINTRAEVPAIDREGREFPVELTVTPLELDGSYTFSGFVHDISERRRRQEELSASKRELEKAKIEAEEANKAKSQFLARMSHEIRTPMNGVVGMLELLRNTELSERQREYLELAEESAQALRELIDDILDLSRIEVGEVELRSVPFDLRDTVGDTLQTLAVRAAAKGLELTYFVPRDVPDPLVGDPGRLRQILVNLTTNSIKFTETGEIVVRVGAEEVEQTEVLLHFQVRDTGPGIDPDEREEIFETFTQSTSTMSRRPDGAGLGLAISAHLVDLMGGEIWVESEPGEGSTFHFTAQFEIREQADRFPFRGPDALEGLPVWIVDDNATNRWVLEQMAENWGMESRLFESGPRVLEALDETLRSGEPPPLVLLDAVMPEVDGFEVARRMREEERFDSTRVVMLSSAGNRRNQARSRDIDIDAMLTKPVKQSQLLDTVTELLEVGVGRRPETERERESQSRADERLRILLAEDGRVNRRVAVRLLEQRGHDVVAVEDGSEALEAFEEGDFDLVLMDVRMPNVDGLEATGRIRDSGEAGADIPIVALTAHAMKGDREECLEAGMDGYISKPIEADKLFDTVERLASRRSESGLAEPSSSSYDEPLAWERALERVTGGEEGLRELVGIFLEELPRQRRELQEGVASQNGEAVGQLAHTLKGSLEYFAADAAADAATRLERAADSGAWAEAREAFEELEHQLERVRDAIIRRFDDVP